MDVSLYMLKRAEVAPFRILIFDIIVINFVECDSKFLFGIESFLLSGSELKAQKFQQSPLNLLVNLVESVAIVFPVLNQNVPGSFYDYLVLFLCQRTGNQLENLFQEAHKIHRDLGFLCQEGGRNWLSNTVIAVLLTLELLHRVDQVMGHHVLN